MTTEPTDPLEGLTDEERKRLRGHGVAADLGLLLAAERRESARLREELTDAKSAIVAFLADFEKWQDCIVEEDGEVHDLGVLRAVLAGEAKCKNCNGWGYVDEDLEHLGSQRTACGECEDGRKFKAGEAKEGK